VGFFFSCVLLLTVGYGSVWRSCEVSLFSFLGMVYTEVVTTDMVDALLFLK